MSIMCGHANKCSSDLWSVVRKMMFLWWSMETCTCHTKRQSCQIPPSVERAKPVWKVMAKLSVSQSQPLLRMRVSDAGRCVKNNPTLYLQTNWQVQMSECCPQLVNDCTECTRCYMISCQLV